MGDVKYHPALVSKYAYESVSMYVCEYYACEAVCMRVSLCLSKYVCVLVLYLRVR